MASHGKETFPQPTTEPHGISEHPDAENPPGEPVANGAHNTAYEHPEANTTHTIVEDTPNINAPRLGQDVNSKADETTTTTEPPAIPAQAEAEPVPITEDISTDVPSLANGSHFHDIPHPTERQTVHEPETVTPHSTPGNTPIINAPLLQKDDTISIPDIPDTASTSASSISNPALEVDSAFDSDADSAITDVHGLGSTQSARSSIYDFVEEHGRTFHKYKEGKYVLPNDATEQDRLDLQHHLLQILLDGRLHLAPIGKNPQNVLDIGTGTGIWAIEFATKYPSASVIGSDLSPIQPDFVPPNCQFEIDDAEDEWMYSRKFDFIHMRGMMTCFTDPRSVLEKAYNQLQPGGYLEMQDGVFPMHCRDHTLEGTALEQWGKACVEAGEKIGRPWTNTPKYKQWMQEIGFEDVKEKIFEVPTSTWPKGQKAKEVGMWFQADMLDALGATMVLLTKALGWSPERCEVFFVDVRKDLRNRAIHAYMPVHVVWGSKPSLKHE